MKKFTVLSSKNLPTKLPIMATSWYSFLMYYFNAPEWAWTLFIVFFCVIWVVVIINLLNEQKLDIFNEDDKQGYKVNSKSKFQQRLDDYMAQQKGSKNA